MESLVPVTWPALLLIMTGIVAGVLSICIEPQSGQDTAIADSGGRRRWSAGIGLGSLACLIALSGVLIMGCPRFTV
ncbi:hypothetical protein P3T23_009326 [Paraburkholderia sp. GAS448]|uniref:hypothetical protein n=1 Tax=Paraburkholderia sp. GAS448 TaxID=3035136 RepID=UPI003D1A6E5D